MGALSQLSWAQIPAGRISRVALSGDLTLSPSLAGWQRRPGAGAEERVAGAGRGSWEPEGRSGPAWGPRVQTDGTGAEMAEQVGAGRGAGGWGLRGAGCSPSLFFPQYGKKKLKYLPYNHQHEYFFLSECWGPPRSTLHNGHLSPHQPPAAPSDPGIAPKPVRARRAAPPRGLLLACGVDGTQRHRVPHSRAPHCREGWGRGTGWGRGSCAPSPRSGPVRCLCLRDAELGPRSVLTGLPLTDWSGVAGQDRSGRV